MKEGSDEVAKVLELLKTGLELESNGIRFYSKAAEKVKDPKGRQTLRFLINEEKDHLRFIGALKESFEKSNPDKIKGIIDSHHTAQKNRVFPELEGYIEEVKESRGDKAILDEAEKIEKRSIELYTGAIQGITNDDYKEIFNILIKEEEGHLMLVEQMSEYMVLHGVWSGLESYFANE